MKSLLVIDVGNTSMDACVFAGRRMVHRVRTQTQRGWKPLVKKIRTRRRAIDGCIISSVVPKAVTPLKNALKYFLHERPLVVGKDIQVPISNRYRRPHQVGSDRLVNAFSGFRKYGGPLLIVDFGTALTFDWVSRQGAYLGGLIVPGPEIWLEALNRNTALLPKVSLGGRKKQPPPVPGKTTYESIRSGALYGYSAMCDAMITRIRKKYGKQLQVIVCGGQAQLCLAASSSRYKIDQDLTVRGLYTIYKEYKGYKRAL